VVSEADDKLFAAVNSTPPAALRLVPR